MPKVSIIMGVHNGENYVSNAIESILSQTYKNFEFIICNDASSDSSLEIIEKYALKDSRIVVLNNEKNLGLAATLNKCIVVAKGEFIARMDDDDFSFVNRIEKQVCYLDNNPEYSFVGGGIQFVDNNNTFGKLIPKQKPELSDVFRGGVFMHPTIIIKKEVLMSVDGYTSNKYTKRAEDYDLWCKVYQKGYKGANIPDIVLNYFEGIESYKKRKNKDRWDLIILKTLWFKKLEISYFLYIKVIMKEIIAMLTPQRVIGMYRSLKFKK